MKGITIFRHLTDDELKTLAAGMSHVIYTAGEVMTRQGAVAHWLYVLTSGTAEVRAKLEPAAGGGPAVMKTNVMATLAAPDFFGEMGLMTGEPRTADVVATADVECFRLTKETFQRVLHDRPDIANELSDTLAARRSNFIARRDGLDAEARLSLHSSERARILDGIKGFFGL